MGDFLLSEIQTRISQADINTVILLKGLVVFLSFYVISSRTFKKEGIAYIIQVFLDRFLIYFDILDTLQGSLGSSWYISQSDFFAKIQ